MNFRWPCGAFGIVDDEGTLPAPPQPANNAPLRHTTATLGKCSHAVPNCLPGDRNLTVCVWCASRGLMYVAPRLLDERGAPTATAATLVIDGTGGDEVVI